jgi:hypothetical protein
MEFLSSVPSWLSPFGVQSNAQLWVWIVLGSSIALSMISDAKKRLAKLAVRLMC